LGYLRTRALKKLSTLSSFHKLVLLDALRIQHFEQRVAEEKAVFAVVESEAHLVEVGV
jgi:hypothetical protein